MSRAPRFVSVVLAGVALAGCDDGSQKADPKPVTGVPKEVADTVARLDRATRTRDWEAVCSDLLTADARERAGGERCVELLGESGAEVRRPRIELLSIQLGGERAAARVRTRADDQGAIVETLALAREGGAWRIDALGD